MREQYCGKIAVEFMHLQRESERNWFGEKFEAKNSVIILDSEKINALIIMLKAKAWEQFLAQKFPTLKRYSGEGAESVLALTLALIEDSSKFNISQVIIGGSHRGRIALQTVLFNFPASQLFRKMRGMAEFPPDVSGAGDVLTHQHSHFDFTSTDGSIVHISTLPNPSHLEANLPVTVGKCRARAQTFRMGDYSTRNARVGDGILPVFHHGDGAFTGQASFGNA